MATILKPPERTAGDSPSFVQGDESGNLGGEDDEADGGGGAQEERADGGGKDEWPEFTVTVAELQRTMAEHLEDEDDRQHGGFHN